MSAAQAVSAGVNGRVVQRRSHWLWFAPRFDFALGRHYAIVEVRVAFWLALDLLNLYIDNRLVYVEGRGQDRGSRPVTVGGEQRFQREDQ